MSDLEILLVLINIATFLYAHYWIMKLMRATNANIHVTLNMLKEIAELQQQVMDKE